MSNEKKMPERAILKNKYYLYATEFFAGMSVMAVNMNMISDEVGYYKDIFKKEGISGILEQV